MTGKIEIGGSVQSLLCLIYPTFIGRQENVLILIIKYMIILIMRSLDIKLVKWGRHGILPILVAEMNAIFLQQAGIPEHGLIPPENRL